MDEREIEAVEWDELRRHLEAGRPWLDPMTWLIVDEAEAAMRRLADRVRDARGDDEADNNDEHETENEG